MIVTPFGKSLISWAIWACMNGCHRMHFSATATYPPLLPHSEQVALQVRSVKDVISSRNWYFHIYCTKPLYLVVNAEGRSIVHVKQQNQITTPTTRKNPPTTWGTFFFFQPLTFVGGYLTTNLWVRGWWLAKHGFGSWEGISKTTRHVLCCGVLMFLVVLRIRKRRINRMNRIITTRHVLYDVRYTQGAACHKST